MLAWWRTCTALLWSGQRFLPVREQVFGLAVVAGFRPRVVSLGITYLYVSDNRPPLVGLANLSTV